MPGKKPFDLWTVFGDEKQNAGNRGCNSPAEGGHILISKSTAFAALRLGAKP